MVFNVNKPIFSKRFNYTELVLHTGSNLNVHALGQCVFTLCLSTNKLCLKVRRTLRKTPFYRDQWYAFEVKGLLPQGKRAENEFTLTLHYSRCKRIVEESFSWSHSPLLVFYPTATTLETLHHASLLHQRRRRDTHAQSGLPGACQKHSWRIPVEDLAWEDVIIEPRVIDLGFCQGNCSVVDDNNQIVLNGYIRKLFWDHAHSNATEIGIPPPCCVATGLSRLSLLYMLNGSFTVTHASEMVVDRCMCV